MSPPALLPALGPLPEIPGCTKLADRARRVCDLPAKLRHPPVNLPRRRPPRRRRTRFAAVAGFRPTRRTPKSSPARFRCRHSSNALLFMPIQRIVHDSGQRNCGSNRDHRRCLIHAGARSSFLVDWPGSPPSAISQCSGRSYSVKIALFSAVFVASAAPIWLSERLRCASRRRRAPGARRICPGIAGEREVAGGDRALHAPLPWRPAVELQPSWLRRCRARLVRQLEYGAHYSSRRRMDAAIRSTAMIQFYLFRFPVRCDEGLAFARARVSALVAGIVYWACGEIGVQCAPPLVSAAAAAHGSVLLGFFFAIEAWSFDLDRYCFSMATMESSWRELYRRPRPVAVLTALIALCCVAPSPRRECAAALDRIPIVSAALIFGTHWWFRRSPPRCFSAPM